MWHPKHWPPNALTTSLVPRELIVVPDADTASAKNSQSSVIVEKPALRLTIDSVGTIWTIVPTGNVPPVGEFAIASASR